MRALVLATLLLASSSLASFPQEEGKPPISSPQSMPAQAAPADQSLKTGNQPADQRQSKGEERKVDRDWPIRRDEGDRMNRDDRDMGRDVRRGDRDEYREERGRYGDWDDHRGWHRPDRDRDYRSYDDDRPRRRVKVCVEYESGDEYCRYRR